MAQIGNGKLAHWHLHDVLDEDQDTRDVSTLLHVRCLRSVILLFPLLLFVNT